MSNYTPVRQTQAAVKVIPRPEPTSPTAAKKRPGGPVGILPERKPGISAQIGDAILAHVNVTPAAVNRFHSEPNTRGLFLALDAGEEKRRLLVVDVAEDSKERLELPSEDATHVFVDLANLGTLAPDRLEALRSALRSHDGADDQMLSASKLGEYFFEPTAEPEPDQQIYAGLLARSDLAVWLGREKHRKSNVILQLAICAALGRDFLGFRFVAEKPLRVTLIDFESKSGSLKQRYDGIAAAMELDEQAQQLLRENLHILEVKRIRKAGHIFPKFPLPGKGKNREADLNFWRDLVVHNPADLYIIDPLRTLHSADENDSTIEALLTEMQRIFGQAAVILCHHMRKSGENACTLSQDMRTWSDGARGSSAIKAHTDTIVLQERTENGKGEEVVYLGAFLKDGADVNPFPVIETDHQSFFWVMKREVPEKLDSACQALVGGKYKNKGQAAAAIQKQTGVGRATAWRHLDELIRLNIVIEDSDGFISTGAVG